MGEKRKMKTVGGTNLPSHWERFDRLQRTAEKLGALKHHPKGVFRFRTREEFEEWKTKVRLGQLEK